MLNPDALLPDEPAVAAPARFEDCSVEGLGQLTAAACPAVGNAVPGGVGRPPAGTSFVPSFCPVGCAVVSRPRLSLVSFSLLLFVCLC